jgi:hypothetical protein
MMQLVSLYSIVLHLVAARAAEFKLDLLEGLPARAGKGSFGDALSWP